MENEDREPTIHPVSFSVLKKEEVAPFQGEIGLWKDTSVLVTIEVGRAKKYVKDVLDIKEGSIIELDKGRFEPFDILANGRLIAKGQVIVTNNDNLGVRVTELANE